MGKVKDIYLVCYEAMCVGCEYEKRCHEQCITCTDFIEYLEDLEKEYKEVCTN